MQSERSHIKDHILDNSTFMKSPKVTKPERQIDRIVVAQGWELKGMKSVAGYRVSIQGNEDVKNLDYGDSSNSVSKLKSTEFF